MTIKVILADDHMVVRDGLKAVIERKCSDIEVVGEASTGAEVLDMVSHTSADVYVLDIAMPVLNGIETAERLKALAPDKKVIILSVHDSVNFVEKALQAGADGYLLKQSPTMQVIDAIREVYAGGSYLSPRIARYVVQEFLSQKKAAQQVGSLANLTKREREILQLLAEGATKKDIAGRLAISVNTIHVHINNIMQKLSIHSRAELIRFAIREGIAQA